MLQRLTKILTLSKVEILTKLENGVKSTGVPIMTDYNMMTKSHISLATCHSSLWHFWLQGAF